MTPLPKAELKRQVKKMLRDPNRGISIDLFAELCGVSPRHLTAVFLEESVPLTEMVQIRVNRGLHEMQEGRVKIMKRPNNTRYVDYRREAKPVLTPHMGLTATSEGIKLKIGLKNRSDYSGVDLDEAMRG